MEEIPTKSIIRKTDLDYLDYLVDPSFQWVNRFFVSSSENDVNSTGRRGYFLPIVEIKDYNVMINEQNF